MHRPNADLPPRPPMPPPLPPAVTLATTHLHKMHRVPRSTVLSVQQALRRAVATGDVTEFAGLSSGTLHKTGHSRQGGSDGMGFSAMQDPGDPQTPTLSARNRQPYNSAEAESRAVATLDASHAGAPPQRTRDLIDFPAFLENPYTRLFLGGDDARDAPPQRSFLRKKSSLQLVGDRGGILVPATLPRNVASHQHQRKRSKALLNPCLLSSEDVAEAAAKVLEESRPVQAQPAVLFGGTATSGAMTHRATTAAHPINFAATASGLQGGRAVRKDVAFGTCVDKVLVPTAPSTARGASARAFCEASGSVADPWLAASNALSRSNASWVKGRKLRKMSVAELDTDGFEHAAPSPTGLRLHTADPDPTNEKGLRTLRLTAPQTAPTSQARPRPWVMMTVKEIQYKGTVAKPVNRGL